MTGAHVDDVLPGDRCIEKLSRVRLFAASEHRILPAIAI
jgi:hypothetical protein